MEWTYAGRSHNCRYNKSHRISTGQKRLTVKQDGDELHYCVVCAKVFLANDIGRLNGILAAMEDGPPKRE